MPLGFFAPFFLAGVSLIAIPWIIHRIRRPEREPLKFSSLMFMPKASKEVIERQKLQHWLLMLLRMAAFLFLALAFSRPFWRLAANPDQIGSRGARRLILLDVSASMEAKDIFSGAVSAARDAVRKADIGDELGLVVFAERPEVLVPLEADSNEHRERIERALNELKSRPSGTDGIAALNLAQDLLTVGEKENTESSRRLVIHLISDFQRSGLAPEDANFRLSPRVELETTDVGINGIANRSIVDLKLKRTTEGIWRVQAKIKNWTMKAEQETTSIEFGTETGAKDNTIVAIRAGDAAIVSFTPPRPQDVGFKGFSKLYEDDYAFDNRRDFAWSPPRKRRLLVVESAVSDAALPPSYYVSRALGADTDDPWEIVNATPQNSLGLLANQESRPDAALFAGGRDWDRALADAAGLYLRSGGRALVLADASSTSNSAYVQFLASLDARIVESEAASSHAKPYELLSWLDFSHPIFKPFEGVKHNDFSQIRFKQTLPLETSERAVVLARFEPLKSGDGRPAIFVVTTESGRAVVWAFSFDPAATNLAKSVKFVPLLVETLGHLTRSQTGPVSGDFSIPPQESDPTRISPEEFSLKMTAPNPSVAAADPSEKSEADPKNRSTPLWRGLLAVMGLALLIESWYAPRLLR